MQSKITKLNTGEILTYDFGDIKVHNYATEDAMNDQVVLLEKAGQLVIIESPAFHDSEAALEDYIKTLDVNLAGILLAYHQSGGHFAPEAKKFATAHADEYGHHGGGKNLNDGFIQAFGEAFDGELHTITDHIDEGEFELGGIKFNIISTSEAYDLEIPEINCVYTHMLGSACHSIIAGSDHAAAFKKLMQHCVDKNYTLIFTGHYIPEPPQAAVAKIAYIEKLLEIIKEVDSAAEMIAKAKIAFPDYSGENYLEMTAGFFFPTK